MALLALILYTPTSTAPAPASAPATSQPRDLLDSPCVVVNRSKVMPRRCQVSRACSGSSGTTTAGRFQSHLPFPHPSAHRRLGSGTSPAARKACAVPPVKISSTPRSESPLTRSTSYVSLDSSFARIVYAYIYIYDRVCVRARIYMYMCMLLYPHEFAFVYTHKRKCSFLRVFACVRLYACLRTDLIKTQNVFARKIFQHSNALWVQKLSGCTIYVYDG